MRQEWYLKLSSKYFNLIHLNSRETQFVVFLQWNDLWPSKEKHRKKLLICTLGKRDVTKQFSKAARSLPVSIFPSCAAGPSGITLFTCRNSSGSSPPMMVNPKPMLLFFRVVLRNVPFNWDASRVKSGFSTLANIS